MMETGKAKEADGERTRRLFHTEPFPIPLFPRNRHYKRKHNLAKQHVKKYYRDLSRLEKINMKEKK